MYLVNRFLGFSRQYRVNGGILGSGATVEFDNPMPVHKVWRDGTPYQGQVTIPTGYTAVTWQIIEHQSRAIVQSGSGLNVTWTPTWSGTGCNMYDLLLIASKPGYPTIQRIYPGEIRVLLPTFTEAEADLVWDLSGAGMGSKDLGWIDRGAGASYYKIYVKGNYNIPTTGFATTSTTSVNLSTLNSGSTFSITVGTGLSYTTNQSVLFASASAPDTDRVYGRVSSYNSGTGAMNIFVLLRYGTATKTDWDVTHAGAALNPYYIRSDTGTKPVAIQFNDNTITSGIKMLPIGPCKNVYFDGCVSEAVPYGLKLRKAQSGDQENCVFEAVDTLQPTRRSSRVWMCGIDVDNINSNRGGTAFQITTQANINNNWDNYQMDTLVWFRLLAQNTRDEGYYIYHTNDQLNGSYSFAPGIRNIFTDIHSNHTGNEGIQFSSLIDSNVFKSSFKDAGTRNNSVHRNGFQFGGGNSNVGFFMNLVEVSKNICTGSTGRHGNNLICCSNHITSTGRNASDGVNFQHTLEESVVTGTVNWRFKNNTIAIKGVSFTNIPFSIYRSATTTTHDKLRIDGNLITSNTATQTEFPGGWSPGAQLVTDNQQFTNIATPGFVDHTTNNYHLATTGSAAFRARTIVSDTHPFANYDFEGVEFLAAHPVDGCYSGYELYTT